MNDALNALHAELDFDRWKPELQAISGIWASIETLQRQVAKDPKSLKQYRAYLVRCLANLLANDVELADTAAEARTGEWQRFLTERHAALAESVAARGSVSVEEWCAKWLPELYGAYGQAMVAVVAKPTKRTFDTLMDATKAMFDRFEGDFAKD